MGVSEKFIEKVVQPPSPVARIQNQELLPLARVFLVSQWRHFPRVRTLSGERCESPVLLDGGLTCLEDEMWTLGGVGHGSLQV